MSETFSHLSTDIDVCIQTDTPPPCPWEGLIQSLMYLYYISMYQTWLEINNYKNSSMWRSKARNNNKLKTTSTSKYQTTTLNTLSAGNYCIWLWEQLMGAKGKPWKLILLIIQFDSRYHNAGLPPTEDNKKKKWKRIAFLHVFFWCCLWTELTAPKKELRC